MPEHRPREIAVFMASPSDLAPERKAFRDVIDGLNKGFADGAGVKFTALGWEDVLAQTGRRAQSVINAEVERCDFFILALHRRWGQPAQDSKASSYTLEEFQLALDRWEKTKSPQIAVFFKNVDQDSIADPGKELQKVLDFRKELEADRQTLYKLFSSEMDFAKEIDLHLRGFAKGEYVSAGEVIELPPEKIEALGKIAPDRSLAAAEKTSLATARAAVEAAGKQNFEDAALLFSRASEDTTNLAVLSLAAEFFRQRGDLVSSGQLINRQATLARDREIAARYYMQLLPKGFTEALMEQAAAPFLSQAPPEAADELRDIYKEAFGSIAEQVVRMMVKYYSIGEIIELARFIASPEGQSTLSKQPLMMAEMMEFGQREFLRILTLRHPELNTIEPAILPQAAPVGQIAAPPAGG